jgi:hypothetical protein
LQSGTAIQNKLMVVGTWDEIGETRGIVPTAQEGTRFLDAIGWARGLPKSSSYTYEIDMTSLVQTTTGTGWTEVFPDPNGIQGAHDGDEVSSSTTNDAKSITHPTMTRCGIRSSTGPDRGIFTPNVDGVDQANVDLYSAIPAVHQLVWQSSVLAVGTHTCKLTVTGTKNGSSSSVNVQPDSWQITYVP